MNVFTKRKTLLGGRSTMQGSHTHLINDRDVLVELRATRRELGGFERKLLCCQLVDACPGRERGRKGRKEQSQEEERRQEGSSEGRGGRVQGGEEGSREGRGEAEVR